jgi:ferredoxin
LAEKLQKSHPGLSPEQWVKLRKYSQIFFIFIFLVFFLWSRREFYLNPAADSGIKGKLINLPLKLDPLVMLAQVLASRAVLAGSLLALFTIILTLIFGRIWCGWFCPVGTLLDWFPIRSWKKMDPSVPEWLRGIKYILLLVILFASVLSNLSLLLLDPITIFYRTLTTAIWPALDKIVTAIEFTLYKISFLQPAISGFDTIIRPTVLPSYPAVYRFGALFFGFFLSLFALNIFAPRFWCRYLCPLGGMLGLLGKFSLIHCEISENCTICGNCISSCPTGAIQTKELVFCDPGECTMCMACAADCPGGAIQYPAKIAEVIHQPYDIERKKALISLGTAAIGVGLLESNLLHGRVSPQLLRPPGVFNEEFLSKCIRCGECSTVCPTNAIQLAVAEAGVVGFWSPVLVPRIGYCDYSCNACGQVCPVEAIPPLSLEDKRKQVVGKAEIDQDRCLPWAEDQHCIVCEEMCPIPDKAIRLTEIQVVTNEGEEITLLRPEVIRNKCTGCGICENKCPVSGEAAIVIRPHGRRHQNSHSFESKVTPGR